MRTQSIKIDRINQPILGITNSDSYRQFTNDSRLYISCGDSAFTDLPDKCVDLVVTDPPFFDNVHYSQLADFFFAWQKLILDDTPSHGIHTTRSTSEVQNSDADVFTERLSRVFQESCRVLKDNGLLVFTYHHSRWEGWRSVLRAIGSAGFRIQACHPVKAELSVATPKHQAKAPINFDIVLVCRKGRPCTDRSIARSLFPLAPAVDRAKVQIARLSRVGWQLSRNDIAVIVMAQVVADISRQPEDCGRELLFDEVEGSISEAVDELHKYEYIPQEGSIE